MLKVENLTKRYKASAMEATGGVSDVTFEVAAGEFYTLLGPSGCGKTTTLRCIAGLEEPAFGRITLGGRDVFSSSKKYTSSIVRAQHRHGVPIIRRLAAYDSL